MNTELLEALSILEKEKNISRDTILDAIEQSRDFLRLARIISVKQIM